MMWWPQFSASSPCWSHSCHSLTVLIMHVVKSAWLPSIFIAEKPTQKEKGQKAGAAFMWKLQKKYFGCLTFCGTQDNISLSCVQINKRHSWIDVCRLPGYREFIAIRWKWKENGNVTKSRHSSVVFEKAECTNCFLPETVCEKEIFKFLQRSFLPHVRIIDWFLTVLL